MYFVESLWSNRMPKRQPDEGPLTFDRLLTADEVARILHVSRTLVYWLIERGDLPAVRFGRALRFRREDVYACIRKRAVILPKGSTRKRRNT